MLENIKKYLKIICEDWLTLEDKLVEIGYLTFLAQEGKLNKNREDKLRDYIKDATEEISSGISRWLFSHGLVEKAESIGGDYSDWKYSYEGIFSESKLLEIIQDAVREDGYAHLTKEINKHVANPTYFGELTEDEIKEVLEPYIQEEEYTDYEEGEEVLSYKYFNGDEDDVFDIMVELTGKQVHNNAHFINMADDFVDAIKNVEKGIDIYDINKLVVAFDYLKDLNHYNGNMLADYNDVDWDSVNMRIESKVKERGLVKV